MDMMITDFYITLIEKMVNSFKATVVPKSLIKTVLQEMRDHFGHFGIGKTSSLLKRYYYWPKMIKHIQAHVDSCSLCRRENLQAEKYQLQKTEISKKPFAKVSIDLIVELPVSHSGDKNILVMTDHLTGWPIATAIPDKETTTVANAIYQDIVLVHGCPEILLSGIKNLQIIFWHMSVKNLTQRSILLVLTHPDQMAKQKTLTNFRKLP